MAEYEEADVIIVSDKGQVVIPQSIRQKLGIKRKTKLLVYGYKDGVVMKKIDTSNVEKDLKDLFSRVDAKRARYGELSDAEINRLVHLYRRQKKTK
jgi:AbrB family looped-hinge helix DNA binding protein